METVKLAVARDNFLAVVKPFVVESALCIPLDDQKHHHFPMPLMKYFLRSLLVCTDNTDKVYKAKLNVSNYFYQFLARYGPDRLNDSAIQYLKAHYNDSILRLSNCLYEAGQATPEEVELISSMTAEVSDTAVTTGDIHSILLCLKFTKEPH